MPTNNGSNVLHAAVTDLDSFFVDNFVAFVVLVEGLEISCNIGCHIG